MDYETFKRTSPVYRRMRYKWRCMINAASATSEGPRTVALPVEEDWLDFENFFNEFGVIPANVGIYRHDARLGFVRGNVFLGKKNNPGRFYRNARTFTWEGRVMTAGHLATAHGLTGKARAKAHSIYKTKDPDAAAARYIERHGLAETLRKTHKPLPASLTGDE